MKKFSMYFVTLFAMIMAFSNVSLALAASEVLEESIVEDIEVSDYKDEISVGETVELTTSIVPSDSTETITYSSGNKSVATITSAGKIEGISKGETTITISAGDFSKTFNLKVRISAKDIKVRQEYVVLKVGETFDLDLSVMPENADVTTTFKSTNEAVATVTAEGVITGKGVGSSSVIIENKDVTKIVNVMVNGGTSNVNSSGDVNGASFSSDAQSILSVAEGENIVLQGVNTERLDKTFLKAIIGTSRNYIVQYEDYYLTLRGCDIINTDNQLKTDIRLDDMEQGLGFYVNDGNSLPGKIYITLNSREQYRHLYIYNRAKSCYQELEFSYENNTFLVDTPGQYLLTTKKLPNTYIPWIWLIISATVILAGVVVYMCLKNKHWFW